MEFNVKEMREKIKEHLKNKFNKINILDNGGTIRQASGETVESLQFFIWEEVGKYYPKINKKILKGDYDTIKIFSESGENYIEESVDCHCYINDEFVLAVECKTYLDKPYLQRANDDFRLMRKGTNIKNTIILSLENSIADNALNFFLEDGNLDNVFFLANGKRNSASNKRIYREDSWCRISDNLIENYIYFLKRIFDEYNS